MTGHAAQSRMDTLFDNRSSSSADGCSEARVCSSLIRRSLASSYSLEAEGTDFRYSLISAMESCHLLSLRSAAIYSFLSDGCTDFDSWNARPNAINDSDVFPSSISLFARAVWLSYSVARASSEIDLTIKSVRKPTSERATKDRISRFYLRRALVVPFLKHQPSF